VLSAFSWETERVGKPENWLVFLFLLLAD
jgi:hypothetical protein